MGTGRGDNGPSKKDRREQAREHARLLREEAKRKARRRKWFLQGGIALGIVAVLAIVALVIVNSVKPEGPGPKNMASDGIVLTGATAVKSTPGIPSGGQPTPTALSDDGVPHIRVYLDYQCPYCNQFETTNGPQLASWLDAGKVTLEVHPIAMLDSSSLGSRYSSRAANAAACVANYEPEKFLKVNTALFANQPQEGTKGLPNDKLLSILKGAGASSKSITDCVNDETFRSWVSNATTRALTKPLPNSPLKKINGTPTILVGKQPYTGGYTDAKAFAEFVMAQVGAQGGATPTPTPTPSAG